MMNPQIHIDLKLKTPPKARRSQLDKLAEALGVDPLAIRFAVESSKPGMTEEKAASHLGVSPSNMRYQLGTGFKNLCKAIIHGAAPSKRGRKANKDHSQN